MYARESRNDPPDTADAELQRCLEIRRLVFIEEQGVQKNLELDGLEHACTHFLVWHEEGDPPDRAIGTARLWTDEQGQAKAQRVAVLAAARESGAGRSLMRRLEATARDRGHTHLALGAQRDAITFYEGLGYRAYGEEFDDAGIPHRMMEYELGD